MREASYRTYAHILPGTYVLVVLLMNVGMLPMFYAIWQGGGVVLCMAALFLPMVVVAATVAGPAEYRLSAAGLSRTVSPYVLSFLFRYSKTTAYAWSQLTSFKNDKELNRSLEEYEFLELHFKQGTKWTITDQKNRQQFGIFRDAFLECVQQINKTGTAGTAEALSAVTAPEAKQTIGVQPSATATQQPAIARKKAFYETRIAKLVYWLLAVLVSCLLGFMLLNVQYVSPTNIFRVVFILLPGLAYFYYRLYGKKK